MLANYLSAIKASFVLYDLPYHVLIHPKIKLFQKSVRINRPLNFVSHNIIDVQRLEQISSACDGFKCAQVLRAVFLTGFFWFFRLSNLVPHSLTSLDPSHYLTGHDLFFSKKLIKV